VCSPQGIGWRIKGAGAKGVERAVPVERAQLGASMIDVLDRVLDKGIVIDAWMRVSVAGLDLITVEARVVVASIETYLRHSDDVARMPLMLPAM